MNCDEFSKFLCTFETQFERRGEQGARSQVLPLLSNRKMKKKTVV
jgi:hypothetical protein